MIASLRRIPWYWWILGLAVPGGLIALIIKARGTPVTPKDYGVTSVAATGANQQAAVAAVTQNLVADAQTQASTIRASLSNDPLALSLLGVSPSLVSSTPATSA